MGEIVQAKADALFQRREGANVASVLKRLHEDCHTEASGELTRGLDAKAAVERSEKRRRLHQLEAEMEWKELDEAMNDAFKVLHQQDVSRQLDLITKEKDIVSSLERELATTMVQLSSTTQSLNTLQEEVKEKGQTVEQQDGELAALRARLESCDRVDALVARQSSDAAREMAKLCDQVASLEAELAGKNCRVMDLDGEPERLQEVLAQVKVAHGETERVVTQFESEKKNLQLESERLVSEIAEKAEEVSRRALELEARTFQAGKLSEECRLLREMLESSGAEKAKKERWVWHAFSDVSARTVETKKLDQEVQRLREELVIITDALAERDLAAHHHKQQVSEATVQSEAFKAAVSRDQEDLRARELQLTNASRNLKMLEATLLGKSLEVQRLFGVVATLGDRERESQTELSQLQAKIFTVQTMLQALQHDSALTVGATRISQLESQLQEYMNVISTQQTEFEALMMQTRALEEEARVGRIAEYEDQIKSSEENLRALEAEIRKLRDERPQHVADVGVDFAALTEAARLERESNALLSAQLAATDEQLARKEEELRRARSAHKSSDVRAGSLAAEVLCMNAEGSAHVDMFRAHLSGGSARRSADSAHLSVGTARVSADSTRSVESPPTSLDSPRPSESPGTLRAATPLST